MIKNIIHRKNIQSFFPFIIVVAFALSVFFFIRFVHINKAFADISSIDSDRISLSVSSQTSNSSGVKFSTDGSSLYVLGDDTDTIFQYVLSTPWDITTAVHNRQLLSVENETLGSVSFTFDSQGTKIFVIGQGSIIYQYDLSTPWDITTATYNRLNFDASSVDQNVSDIVLKNDDAKIYILGDNTDTLFQYTINLNQVSGDINIRSISSRVQSGQYTTGDVIDITVTFSESVSSSGRVTVVLETGETDQVCTFTIRDSDTGTCEYTVQQGDVSSDLTVKEISGVITSGHRTLTDFLPTSNLADNKDIVIYTPQDVRVRVSDTTATITWTTGVAASSVVEYGITNNYGVITEEADISPRVTEHSVVINRLLQCSSYYYRVISSDENSNTIESQGDRFTTSGCTGSATVKDQTITSIDKDAGGVSSLISDSKGISLIVPARATEESPVYQIKSLEQEEVFEFSSTPRNVVKVGDYAFDLKSLVDVDVSVTEFSEPIEVTIDYTDEDVVGIDESTLVIYRWNGTVWNRLSGCIVDIDANSVTCTTTRFSVFSLFGEPIAQQVGNTTSNGVVPLWSLGEDVNTPKKQTESTTIPSCEKEGMCPVAGNTIDKSIDSSVSKIGADDSKYLGFGLVDDTVKKLQKYLNSKGYLLNNKGPGSPGFETNFFGPLTKSAVIKFQKANNIKVDGIVGPETNSLIQ